MSLIKEANEPVAKSVICIMATLGVKQKVVAERAGYTESALSDMLNGRKLIKATDTRKLAAALNVTPNELFRTDRAPAPAPDQTA